MLSRLLMAVGYFAILIGAVTGAGIGIEIGRAASPPSSKEIEQRLVDEFTIVAEEINRRSPVMVDKNTRLDRAQVGPGARLTYFYTLLNLFPRNMRRGWFSDELKPRLIEIVCANADMRPSLQFGATYAYAYSGNDGVEIGRFEIDKYVCPWGATPAMKRAPEWEPSLAHESVLHVGV